MVKLFKLLAILTVLLLTMQPLAWAAWGSVFVLFAIAWCASVWRRMA